MIYALKLYHGTTKKRAREIVRRGFRDAVGNYGIFTVKREPVTRRGVWLSNYPLDENQGLPFDTDA